MKQAHQQLVGWFESAHLETETDALGNLIGRPPRNKNAVRGPAVFMIGSHLDTVVDAGRFDGSLGVLLGLGTIEALAAVLR